MLAGCSSSTLLSPRHRLRSESPAQFQACNFQLPSMSTQRLDLPCNFPRNNDSSKSQPIRPIGISIDKSIEARSCSLRQNIRIPPSPRPKDDHEFLERKSLKRFADQGPFDESCINNRAKRKKGSYDSLEKGQNLSIGQLGSENFWFHQAPFSLSYSGDDGGEKVCFVPSEVISSPTFANQITILGDKNVETSHVVVKKGSRSSSSTSSENHSSKIRRNDNIFDSETGSRNLHELKESNGEENGDENRGVELVGFLMACVEAISSKNIAAIHHFIAKLGELASPKGSTPITRLIAYFTEALALRITRIWPNIFRITIPRDLDRFDDDNGTAFGLLNQVNPIPKFIHFTSNEILLNFFEGKDRVHIIDFDIKQGLQWPSLFQSLATRTSPPTHVRITGIGESKHELNQTGDILSGFAESLNLPFEFHAVVDKLEDVRLWMLHVKEGETVAINCAFQLHKTLYDNTALADVLRVIRSTNPVIMVVAEQENDHNDPSFEKRICNSLKYYSAIFDSLHCTNLETNSGARIKIEEMSAKEIRNIVACEGRERYERHMNFATWRKMIGQGGGFRCVKVGEPGITQSKMLLRMYDFGESFRVEETNGGDDVNESELGITLCWENQPLYTVSAWAPI